MSFVLAVTWVAQPGEEARIEDVLRERTYCERLE
jgi:hypothetical protein